VGDPNVPSGEVATVEHAAPLLALGTVIVPVAPSGTVLTPGDATSGMPFGPTDSPGTIPSEEVAPSEGVAVVMPAWAKAALWHNKAPQNANTAAQAMTFFFIATLILDREHIDSAFASASLSHRPRRSRPQWYSRWFRLLRWLRTPDCLRS
jgi:hypothetical protein